MHVPTLRQWPLHCHQTPTDGQDGARSNKPVVALAAQGPHKPSANHFKQEKTLRGLRNKLNTGSRWGLSLINTVCSIVVLTLVMGFQQPGQRNYESFMHGITLGITVVQC